MVKKKAIASKQKSTTKKTFEATTKMKSFVMVGSEGFYKKIKQNPIIGALLAEFIGVFLLVTSIFAVQNSPLFVAFAIVGIVLVIGGVSGAHINPAMTVGAWVTRKINWITAIGYVAAQCLGAIVAWLLLSTFLKGAEESIGSSTTLFHAATIESGKEWYIFFAEFLGATALALGFARTIKHNCNVITSAFTYGMAMLLALFISVSATGPFLSEPNTGFSFMNPAVAIAANGISSWDIWPIAVFILAPMAGAIFGFIIRDIFSQTDKLDCEICN